MNKTILLVDDEPITALFEKTMLDKYGYSVIVASSGDQAIKIASENRSIDCILMDIDMGDGIDGTLAAKIILKDRDIPVIFLSDHTEPEIVEKTESITSYGYVVKNTGITILDASIKMAFKLFDARQNIQGKNCELDVANEELRVAIEELEATNEHLQVTIEELETANEQLIQSEQELMAREEALIISEKRYKSLFENMNEGFYLAELVFNESGKPIDWKFIDVNPAHSKIIGLKRDDVIGHTIHELYPTLEKEWFEVTSEVAITQKPAVKEGFVKATGRYYINYYYSPAPNQFACFFSDITERINATEELRHSEERYRTLVEYLPVGIFRFHLSDPEKFIDANIALAKMDDEPSAESIMQRPVSSFFTEKDEMYTLLSILQNEGAIKNRLTRLRKKTGELIWASITAVCHYNQSGEAKWVQGIIEDVTEKIEIEEKLTSHLIFLETLINIVNSPVYYKNSSGLYIGCNNAFAEQIIGLPREQIINKSIFELKEKIPHDLALKYAAKDKELFDNPGTQVYESQVKCADGKTRYYHFDKSIFKTPDGQTAGIIGIMLDITERIEKETELKRINQEFNLLISSMSSIIIGVSLKDRITHWNPYAEKVFGIKSSVIMGKLFCESGIKWDWGRVYEAISKCIIDDHIIRLDDIKYEKKDGRNGILGLTVTPLEHEGNILEGFLLLGRDITDQRFMEQQLMQGSKLEAIGQLAAGVAHEINTPLQYVGDNIRFITKSFAVLLSILDIYQRASANYNDPEFFLQKIREIEDLSEKEMFSFILEELPGAIDQSLEGVEKVSSIVQSMKAFSHPGIGRKIPADINKSIENTVTVSRNEWKYNCELKLNLDYNLPEVPCYESELNQVILNIIVNASDAIHDNIVKGNIEKGLIIISTFTEEYHAVITVSDNGGGIPENIRDKIFNPFFTTKEVGKGTGQGLPLSFSIIHEKHGGTLSYETKIGEGTTFIVKLPFEDE